MVIDSSALVAIALRELDAERISAVIGSSYPRRMSVVNWFETLLVLGGRVGTVAANDTMLTFEALNIELVSFDPSQMLAAHTAWQRFGKGRHPAALNLADCCAYAAAVTLNEPLLFKGNDFALTDVPRVRW